MKKAAIILSLIVISFSAIAQGKKAHNIALVMPFCAQKIIDNPNHAEAELGNISREYYQGALIALDSFERAKIPVRLAVFDTDNDSLTMVKQMQKTAFKESEVVIGPILQGGNKMLTPFSKDKKVFHVSPLMTFSKTRINDAFWISSNPDIPGYAQILYDYFLSLHKDSANIIVVSDKSSYDKNIVSAFRLITPPVGKQLKIKVVDYSATLDITQHFSAKIPNYVVVPTSKEQTANKILYQLKDTSAAVSCYGFQPWYDFKNIDFDLWQRKNVHIVTPFFVDYNDTLVKEFVRAYREKFSTEPTEAAFKGYDQMLLYGYAIHLYGRNFMEKLAEHNLQALHTTYRFKKQKEGFWQNTFLNIIRLKDDVPVKIN